MDEASAREWREPAVRRLPGPAELISCSEAGREVGWSTLCPLDPASAYGLARQLAIYVSAEHRRRGVADWLLARSAGAAERAGVETVVALPPAERPWIASWLCRRGFQRCGRAPGAHPAAGGSEAVVLRLSLGERPA